MFPAEGQDRIRFCRTDGTATISSRQDTTPSQRHGSATPLSCSWSSSAQTCSTRRTEDSTPPDTPAPTISATSAHPPQLCHDIRSPLASETGTSDQHPLRILGNKPDGKPECFAHYALGAVAVDSVVKTLLGNDDAGLTAGVGLAHHPCGHETPLKDAPRIENRLVFRTGKPRGHRLYPQTCVKRLRPLARRAARTLRPPFVALRARKPILRARFTFEGCHIIFISLFLSSSKKFGVDYNIYANITQPYNNQIFYARHLHTPPSLKTWYNRTQFFTANKI